MSIILMTPAHFSNSYEFDDSLIANPSGDMVQLEFISKLKEIDEEKNKTIILYHPPHEYYILNDTVFFDGYVDTTHGIPNTTIGFYESNKGKQHCLLDEYVIKDPISTYFTFTSTVNQTLLECDEDFSKDSKLEFMAKINSYYSNVVELKIVSSKQELPIPRWQFTPEAYNIPIKIEAIFSSNGVNWSSEDVYLNKYHLHDKYSDNLERYYPLESLDPRDNRDPIYINKTQMAVSLIFESDSENNKKEPFFINVFVKENKSDENSNNTSYFNLYELKQIGQNPWKFSIPILPAGSYDLIIRSFFGEVVGEYLLKVLEVPD